MQIRPTITFRDIPHSQAIEHDILRRIDKLEHYFDHLTRVEVVIEQVQKHKHNGKLYRPCISLSVPGEHININRSVNEDVYVALRDAFLSAQRRLKSYASKLRRDVKSHVDTVVGKIVRLHPDEGFGFIEANGVEYYFSSVHIHNADFDRLREGMLVQFTESFHATSPQAHCINLMKRPEASKN